MDLQNLLNTKGTGPNSSNSLWKILSQLSPIKVFTLVALFAAASVFFGKDLKFSYAFDDFFPKGDAELDFYYAFRDRFTPDDNFLLIGFENKEIFNAEFIEQLDSITRQLNKIEMVDRAVSLANYRYFVKTGFGYFDYPAIHADDPERWSADSIRLSEDERVIGKLLSADFKTTIIYIQTADSLLQDDNASLIQQVNTILANNGQSDAHLLGKAFFEVELIQYQKIEFVKYALLSILMVVLIIYLIFRSLWCVAIAISTVTITLLLFIGLLAITGRELNVMSTLFPIIIIIVGISDTIHFLSRYIAELRSGNSKQNALYITLRDTGQATFLTSLTTSIGFITLLSSNIYPVREFGMLAAIGVLLAYVVTITFTTTLLKIFTRHQLEPDTKNRWRTAVMLENIYAFTLNRKKIIIGLTAAIVIIFSVGIFQISTDIKLSEGLPANTKVKDDFLFFEKTFNGFRPFEIAVVAKSPYTIYSPEVLRDMDKVEAYAGASPIIGGLQSITAFYKTLNRAANGDNASAYHLPDSAKSFDIMQREIKRFGSKEVQFLVTPDAQWGRISGNMRDAGTDSIRKVQEDIYTFIRNNTDTTKTEFRITGTGIMFDKNNAFLRKGIIYGVIAALLAISILMSFVYKNIKLTLISIIPNVIPLIITAGILGYFKIPLDAPTSIIFGISYGIVVDDTIHFLSRFKIERMHGVSVETAIHNTMLETGRALFITTAILIAGFSVLMLSSLHATFNVGMLLVITLFTALIADVYLLPLLIRKWLK